MITQKWAAGIGLLAISMGVAQEEHPSLPKTPTSFETRNTGDSEEGEVAIKKEEAKPTKVTFTAVTDSRDWKDTTGKVIRGRLLAFEAAEGEVADLVRNGKVRLLVDGAKRFSLLPLERLSTEARAHIDLLAATRKKQAGEKRDAGLAKP